MDKVIILKCSISAYILIFLAIAIFQRSFVYFPNEQKANINKLEWAKEINVTTSDDVELYGWLALQNDSDAKGFIIFFHGNAGNLDDRVEKAKELYANKYSILLVEYRGYGSNASSPSEKGFYHDADAFINFVKTELKIPNDEIILYGESLGSGVAVEMALRHEAKALILDVPFFSLLEMARFRFPFIPFHKQILKDQFRNDLKIKKINIPVFIGLAEKDIVIPHKFGKKLYEVANQPKDYRIYPNVGHMGIYEKGFVTDFSEFLTNHTNEENIEN